MKRSRMEILRCLSCKGKLKLQIETENDGNVTEGSMICINCKNKYLIVNGIPRMYISDNEIVAGSNLSDFIMTPENLDVRIKSSKTRFNSKFFTNKILTIFLVTLGWVSFFSNISLLILYFNFDIAVTDKIHLLILLLFTIIFFIIDYSRYRIWAKINYLKDLRTLKRLSDTQKLSEYDIRMSREDREDTFKNQFKLQKDFVSYKGEKIASILNNYDFKVKTALNVGCGGALHKSASKPYFDEGYDMIGVDISEEYLKQFTQIFDTDGILANSMALPFESNTFDLINFTDIVEHLHHPLLGLREAQRVLKAGGVLILSTNNRCAITSKRYINPFIFAEKIIGLYYDKILPPKSILGRWMDFNFYHTEFSKNEVTELMKAAGFEILRLETQFPIHNKLTKIFKKIPALRFMCSELIIIGKKKRKEISNNCLDRYRL